MAEFVQTSIEEMFGELEQMERVGLFTKAEIKQILQKRKAFEYKLRRRTKMKEDYLKYAQYEINLLSLVKKRRKKIGYWHKKTEIDGMVVQRIHKLFRAAIVRFQDDVTLWLTHIEFCKAQREKFAASKQYTRMLQVHSKKPDLWVQAAKWDLDENLNPENARSLLQRALRFNPDSQHLWREYYRLELLFTEKMLGRRHMMGLDEEKQQDPVLNGQIAQIVYEQAMQKFPDDLQFLLSLLNVAKLFEFAKDHTEKIYQDLETVYPDNPLTWDALAKRKLTPDQNQTDEPDEEFHAVYRCAVKSLNSDEIWVLYLKACLELIDTCPRSSAVLKAKVQRTLSVFAEASDAATLPEDMWLQWLDLLSRVGQVEKAGQVAEVATERCPGSSLLWKQRLEIAIASGTTMRDLMVMFKQARMVPQKDTWPMMRLLLEFGMQNNLKEEIMSLLEGAMFQCKEVSVPAKQFFLEWGYHRGGISQARQIYNNFSEVHLKSVDLFRSYINMEAAQAKVNVKRLRTAYREAVREFGANDPDLWLEYIKLESTHPEGKRERAGDIYHQAVKSLTGQHNQEFIHKFTLMKTGQ